MLEDLATLPFLAPRRVVLIRDADAFVTANRERLEKYLERPSPTGTLILECRSFNRATRLAKAVPKVGGELMECKKLVGPALTAFVTAEARARGKTLSASAAARLVNLAGADTGVLTGEVEKLALYAGERRDITDEDVDALVGQTREEKIFAALDAAALGRTRDALELWQQVLATDRSAVHKALGGMMYRIRQWLAVHRLTGAGLTVPEAARRLGAWGRDRELEALIRRLPPLLLRRLAAAVAQLDSQAKLGTRSIETGVELILVRLASASR